MQIDPFKLIVWDGMVRAVLGRLFQLWPILGFGPVGFIVTNLVMKFTDYMWVVSRDFVKMSAINIENQEIKRKYSIASISLHRAALKYGIDSVEFNDAKENHLSEFINLISLRPK